LSYYDYSMIGTLYTVCVVGTRESVYIVLKPHRYVINVFGFYFPYVLYIVLKPHRYVINRFCSPRSPHNHRF